jgi:mannose-6-phosphate isomerase-like protein (cupin superfamily)
MSDDSWQVFDLSTEVERQQSSASPYREFVRVPALSCGVYSLAAGATDLQAPHDEDEIYYVVSGSARVRIGDEERSVGAGSVLYVPATEEHSFCEVEEDLTLMVFFASGGP